MSLLNPWALLALLLLPVLVLLYFLKLKRPSVRVASTLLWQKVIEDMRVNSPFQKLRRSLLLLLQILILLAVVFALARPMLKVRDTVAQSVIVLLDTSASMNAREDGDRTRLDLARDEIGRLADALGRNDELMVIAFNARAAVACGFSASPPRIREALHSVRATDSATDIEPALLLARSIANTRAHPRIVLLSDGAFPSPAQVELPVEIQYQAVGTPRDNVAVTGLDVRRSIRDRNRIEMFVSIENFSKAARSGNMQVRLDDTPLDTKYFTVGADETLSQIFEADLPAGGVIHVSIDCDDGLAADNSAWRIVPPPTTRKVLIVGENNFFVERAFKAAPAVTWSTLSPTAYTPDAARDCTAVIWNVVPDAPVAPCDSIYLGCSPAVTGLVAGAVVDTPEIQDWDNRHPVNRFLTFENLLIAKATAFRPPQESTVLLRSSATPLIVLFEHQGRTLVMTGFDPMQSNWPLLLSFPLFLNGCVDHFEDTQARRLERNVTVGRAIAFPRETAAKRATGPDGGELPASQAGDTTTFGPIERAGVYRIATGDGRELPVAANLFSREESRLEPAATLTLGGKTAASAEARTQTNREYWKWLMIAAGAILLGEWVVYHRRLFV